MDELNKRKLDNLQALQPITQNNQVKALPQVNNVTNNGGVIPNPTGINTPSVETMSNTFTAESQPTVQGLQQPAVAPTNNVNTSNLPTSTIGYIFGGEPGSLAGKSQAEIDAYNNRVSQLRDRTLADTLFNMPFGGQKPTGDYKTDMAAIEKEKNKNLVDLLLPYSNPFTFIPKVAQDTSEQLSKIGKGAVNKVSNYFNPSPESIVVPDFNKNLQESQKKPEVEKPGAIKNAANALPPSNLAAITPQSIIDSLTPGQTELGVGSNINYGQPQFNEQKVLQDYTNTLSAGIKTGSQYNTDLTNKMLQQYGNTNQQQLSQTDIERQNIMSEIDALRNQSADLFEKGKTAGIAGSLINWARAASLNKRANALQDASTRLTAADRASALANQQKLQELQVQAEQRKQESNTGYNRLMTSKLFDSLSQINLSKLNNDEKLNQLKILGEQEALKQNREDIRDKRKTEAEVKRDFAKNSNSYISNILMNQNLSLRQQIANLDSKQNRTPEEEAQLKQLASNTVANEELIKGFVDTSRQLNPKETPTDINVKVEESKTNPGEFNVIRTDKAGNVSMEKRYDPQALEVVKQQYVSGIENAKTKEDKIRLASQFEEWKKKYNTK